MDKTKCVVKRKGNLEPYDEKKVYASVYSAALICEYPEKKAEKIALEVMKKVNSWFAKESKRKKCINSSRIRESVLKNLKEEDVALVYRHHFDLS